MMHCARVIVIIALARVRVLIASQVLLYVLVIAMSVLVQTRALAALLVKHFAQVTVITAPVLV